MPAAGGRDDGRPTCGQDVGKPEDARGPRKADALALLGMLAVLVVVYRRVVAGRVLAGGDLQIYFFPYWAAVTRSIHELRVPLWNTALFAGAPLAANSQVGLFYPLNWPFWVLAPATLPAVTRAVHLSLLLHIGLAGASTYVLGRREGLGPWAAAVAGTLYAGSGFLGVHADHLNQLQALAWLPLLFLTRRKTAQRPVSTGGGAADALYNLSLPHPVSLVAYAMILLAGHTQMAFIAAIGVVVWQAVGWFSRRRMSGARARLPKDGVSLVLWLAGLAPFAAAGLIAAVQLLPTLELTGMSARSIGLDWRASVSFSVRPWDLPKALLPPYLTPLAHPEGVATIGTAGLLLACLGGWDAVRTVRRRAGGRAIGWLALAAVGVFLALGGYNPLYLAAVRLHVPGFIHFRAPARFLALYVLGASMLAGGGFARVVQWMTGGSGARGGVMRALLVLGAIGVGWDLAATAEYLPHAQATSPRAFYDLRPATAHLVAAAEAASVDGGVSSRFLSISKLLFEVGDKAEMETVYSDTLSGDAVWAYLVAAKQREVLTPNLPLAFDVPAIDGYDGGLLPMRHYIDLTKLLIPEGTLDGRLRENLAAVPDKRWLDLLGIGYVLTDKTGDAWVDGVLYDRQLQPDLAAGASLDIAWLPAHFAADGVGVIAEGGELTVAIALADGRQLVQVLTPADGGTPTRRVRWAEAAAVVGLSLSSTGDPVQVQGVSLVNGGTGAFYPLAVSDHLRLAHSGDVKIYEAVTRPARVHVFSSCVAVDSPEAGLALMVEPSFDPASTVVIERDPTGAGVDCAGAVGDAPVAAGKAAVVSYGQQEVVVDVTADGPVVLMFADAWYPGWKVWATPASVNLGGDDAADAVVMLPLYRADLAFRGVPLEAGDWRVTFRYEPDSFTAGIVVSAIGIVAVCAYSGWWAGRQHRREEGKTVAER